MEKLDHQGTEGKLLSITKLRGTGWLRENRRQREREQRRQIMTYLLCHDKKCGYHSGAMRDTGSFSRSDCSESHGRKISSVAHWSTKLGSQPQSKKAGRSRWSDEGEQEWKARPNLRYAQSQRVVAIVWVQRLSRRETSRTTPGFLLTHERQRGKKSRCE